MADKKKVKEDFRALEIPAIDERVDKARLDIVMMRIGKKKDELKNPLAIQHRRKEIAKLLTIKREKELQNARTA